MQKQKQYHYCNKLQAKIVFLIWVEKRNHKSNQQVFSNQMQPLSNQLKSLDQPNHYILICFKCLSHQIFESPLIWTQRCIWAKIARLECHVRNSRVVTRHPFIETIGHQIRKEERYLRHWTTSWSSSTIDSWYQGEHRRPGVTRNCY